MKQEITFDEFKEIESKLDIRIGLIIAAERIPKKDKLLKLTVIFGLMPEDEKTVVTNLGEHMEPEELVQMSMPFVMNLPPAKLGGVLSEAMIIAGIVPETGKFDLDCSTYSIGTKLI